MMFRGLLLFLMSVLWVVSARADSIWEYEPYRVKLWLSVDPTLRVSPETSDELLHALSEQIDVAFGATCETEITLSPANLGAKIFADIETLSLGELQSGDLVLVIAKSEAGSIRSAQAAFEKLSKIAMLGGPLKLMQGELAAHSTEESLHGLAEKLEHFEGTFAELASSFRDGKLNAALVNRAQAEKLKEWVRQISVRFPWQVESIVRNHDKVMFANLKCDGEGFVFQIRELDCSMKWMGSVWTRNCSDWNILPRVMLYGFFDAFTPVCRIEQADAKVASLKVKAAGLCSHDDHPALIQPGDVVMPMVKRSDRTGADATLQSVPWTYIAVTDGDRVNRRGSIFSGVRGALQGRQNKRIQRLALVVKTPHASTELQLVSANRTLNGPENVVGTPVPGIAVYQRTPSQDNLEMLERSDWRGIVKLPNTPLPEIEFELPVKTSTPEGVAEVSGSPLNGSDTNSAVAADTVPAESGAKIEDVAKKEIVKAKIQLRVPLYLYYVKNGDIILARLPIVHGMVARETAELPDDSRRLEAEALLKGLQNEIIDTVARRKIIEIKLDKRIKEDKVDEAKKLIEDLRKIPTYDSINERLGEIQQQILKPDKGPITAGTKNRIDVMIDTTRQLMQKYLQIDLVREYEAKMSAK